MNLNVIQHVLPLFRNISIWLWLRHTRRRPQHLQAACWPLSCCGLIALIVVPCKSTTEFQAQTFRCTVIHGYVWKDFCSMLRSTQSCIVHDWEKKVVKYSTQQTSLWKALVVKDWEIILTGCMSNAYWGDRLALLGYSGSNLLKDGDDSGNNKSGNDQGQW